MTIVGVVPAAGYATRLQLLSGSKELLPVSGRPVMDHLVERMRADGCERLRVVTRPEKSDVIAHAEKLGAEVVLAHPATVSESFLAGMAGLVGDEIVLIGLPDSIWEPVDGYRVLVEAVRGGCEVALGLFRLPVDELTRSDFVVRGVGGRIERIDAKPETPASGGSGVCGRACRHVVRHGGVRVAGRLRRPSLPRGPRRTRFRALGLVARHRHSGGARTSRLGAMTNLPVRARG